MRRRPVLLLALLAATPAAARDVPTTWFLLLEPGHQPKLALGRGEGTDDVDVMLSCERGAGVVTVTLVLAENARPPMRLASGPLRLTPPTHAEVNQLSEGVDLTADLAATAPLLARFAATGELAYRAGRRWVATPSAAREATALLAACRARP